MNYRRRSRPDIFQVLAIAQRHVFVRCGASEYLIVAALRNSVCLSRYNNGSREPLSIRYSDESAERLNLFDGQSWDLPALVRWLEEQSQ